MAEAPSFTIGIEEEYLLVHQDTYELATAPDGLIEACDAGEGQVSPEFLQCQIEVGTQGLPAPSAEARDDLKPACARCVARNTRKIMGLPPSRPCPATRSLTGRPSTMFTNKDTLSRTANATWPGWRGGC
jgi:carboxylate-amine ligase